MINKLLLSLLCILCIVALILLTRDNPIYSAGEPTAIVRDWLNNKQINSSTELPVANSVNSSAEVPVVITGELVEETWNEEYLGHGKWVVSRTQLYKPKMETPEDRDKWFDRWKEVDVNKLREYTNDLSPEDLSTFKQGLWTPDSSDDLYDRRKVSWYVYEHSGLVVSSVNDVESSIK